MTGKDKSRFLSGSFDGFPEIPLSTGLVTKNQTGDWRDSVPGFRDKTSPCNHGCPAGVDVRGFIALVNEGEYEKGLGLIRQSS
ncbi:MAG: hypothetical protein HY879_00365, partial [Deltaproteobacteria bacterium]|nr:hypothetical protein [Deltaproteobacteria bacterium]